MPNSSSETVLQHTWALDLYTITQSCLGLVLILLYAIVLHRVCKGTKYPFVVVLSLLFIVSNLSGAIEAIMLHQAITLGSDDTQWAENGDRIQALAKAHEIFFMARIACLDLGMWFFCFRYWNIS